MTLSAAQQKRPIALVVEDEEDIAYVFGIALTKAGFDTEIIGDGSLALERLASITPDILVLDLHLPRVSGDEILKWVRSTERLGQTRIIITSANPRWAERLRQDSDLILIKPVSFAQLRDLAARLKPKEDGNDV